MKVDLSIFKSCSKKKDIENVNNICKKIQPLINNLVKNNKLLIQDSNYSNDNNELLEKNKHKSNNKINNESDNNKSIKNNTSKDLEEINTFISSKTKEKRKENRNLNIKIPLNIKEDIKNWLFSKSIEERVKICSIQNNILAEIIKIALFNINTEKHKDNKKETINSATSNELEKAITDNYNDLITPVSELSLNDNNNKTNDILISLNVYFKELFEYVTILDGEILILSNKLLEDKKLFFDNVNIICNNKFLYNLININKEQNLSNNKNKCIKTKYMYIDLPYWIKKLSKSDNNVNTNKINNINNDNLNIKLIFIAFLDQSIQTKYFVEKSYKTISNISNKTNSFNKLYQPLYKICDIEERIKIICKYYKRNIQIFLNILKEINFYEDCFYLLINNDYYNNYENIQFNNITNFLCNEFNNNILIKYLNIEKFINYCVYIELCYFNFDLIDKRSKFYFKLNENYSNSLVEEIILDNLNKDKSIVISSVKKKSKKKINNLKGNLNKTVNSNNNKLKNTSNQFNKNLNIITGEEDNSFLNTNKLIRKELLNYKTNKRNNYNTIKLYEIKNIKKKCSSDNLELIKNNNDKISRNKIIDKITDIGIEDSNKKSFNSEQLNNNNFKSEKNYCEINYNNQGNINSKINTSYVKSKLTRNDLDNNDNILIIKKNFIDNNQTLIKKMSAKSIKKKYVINDDEDLFNINYSINNNNNLNLKKNISLNNFKNNVIINTAYKSNSIIDDYKMSIKDTEKFTINNNNRVPETKELVNNNNDTNLKIENINFKNVYNNDNFNVFESDEDRLSYKCKPDNLISLNKSSNIIKNNNETLSSNCLISNLSNTNEINNKHKHNSNNNIELISNNNSKHFEKRHLSLYNEQNTASCLNKELNNYEESSFNNKNNINNNYDKDLSSSNNNTDYKEYRCINSYNKLSSSDIKPNMYINHFVNSYNQNSNKTSFYNAKNSRSNTMTSNNSLHSSSNINNLLSNSNLNSNKIQLPKNGSLFQNFNYFPNQSQDFIFNHKLHNDILDTTNDTEINLSILMPYKQLVLNNLREEVNTILCRNVEFEVFGSFAVGFSIESSDIDLNLKLNNEEFLNLNLIEIKEYEKHLKEKNNNYYSYVNNQNINNNKTKISLLDSKHKFNEFIMTLSSGLRNYNQYSAYNLMLSNFNNNYANYKLTNYYEEVTPILSASVPVIKLVIDLSHMISKNDCFYIMKYIGNNYNFPISEIFKIKIDISFSKHIYSVNNSILLNSLSNSSIENKLNNQQTYNSNLNINKSKIIDELAIKNNKSSNMQVIISRSNTPSVEYVKKNLELIKEIKPLILILKRILQIRSLNNPFKGGLSSYSLFLLILAFINVYNKKEINESNINSVNLLPFLGSILIDFLEFYGKLFDFDSLVVNAGDSENPIISTETLEKIIVNNKENNNSKRKDSFVSYSSINSDCIILKPDKDYLFNHNYICLENWNHIISSRIIVVDPINFTNVSQSSFNIKQVQNLFKEAYDFLINFKSNNVEFDFNIVKSLYNNLYKYSNEYNYENILLENKYYYNSFGYIESNNLNNNNYYFNKQFNANNNNQTNNYNNLYCR